MRPISVRTVSNLNSVTSGHLHCNYLWIVIPSGMLSWRHRCPATADATQSIVDASIDKANMGGVCREKRLYVVIYILHTVKLYLNYYLKMLCLYYIYYFHTSQPLKKVENKPTNQSIGSLCYNIFQALGQVTKVWSTSQDYFFRSRLTFSCVTGHGTIFYLWGCICAPNSHWPVLVSMKLNCPGESL